MNINNWYFFPWSVQYVIGGTLALSTSIYLLVKHKESRAYQSFFLFGFSTALWQFLVYLHRNAPTVRLSSLFFRFGLFFISISLPALILTILYLEKKKQIYPLIFLPVLLVGVVTILIAPFEIIWTGTNLGWSYKFALYYMVLFYVTQTGYAVAVILVGYSLRIASTQFSIRKKYLIIVLAFGIFSFGGIALTNFALYLNPDFPPFGGVLTTLEFVVIAYALGLPVEKIKSFPEIKEPMARLSSAYLRILNQLRSVLPGKELGVSIFKFDEYVEAMGLSGVVYVDESKKLRFDSGKFVQEEINEITDSVLRTLKSIPEAKEVSQQFSDVLVETYRILKSKSKNDADEWFDRMIRMHGSFLWRSRILDGVSKKVGTPEIFKDLHPGRVYLFREEKPAQAYKKLKEALNYGFVALCISKLHPEKVRKRYNVGGGSIFWLTFKKAEGTINPADVGKLQRTISEFVKRSEASIVLLDCFDQIKFANGFHKSLTMLKDFRNLCNENNSIMLISINPEMFEKEELAAIEKELGE